MNLKTVVHLINWNKNNNQCLINNFQIPMYDIKFKDKHLILITIYTNLISGAVQTT